MNALSSEAFAQQIQERSEDGYRYDEPDVLQLNVPGGSIQVRYMGAYITQALLSDARGRQADVLYCAEDISAAKLRASHGMTRKEDIGGQHGPGRWMRWDVMEHNEQDSTASVTLNALLPPDHVSMQRSFTLHGHHALTIVSSVKNTTNKPQPHQRLGEHLYFPLKEQGPPDVHILTPTAELWLGEESLRNEITPDGYFWQAFTGNAIVQFANKKLMIRSTLALTGNNEYPEPAGPERMAMMIWRPEGAPFVCLEPVAGYGPEGTDTTAGGFTLAVGATATMRTRLSVIS